MKKDPAKDKADAPTLILVNACVCPGVNPSIISPPPQLQASRKSPALLKLLHGLEHSCMLRSLQLPTKRERERERERESLQ
jgi:hypothetical protein